MTTKYQDLKNEIKRSWKLKNVKIVPVIIGATRIIKKNLIEILKTIPGNITTTVGGSPGFSDEPEKSPRNKTLRTTKVEKFCP